MEEIFNSEAYSDSVVNIMSLPAEIRERILFFVFEGTAKLQVEFDLGALSKGSNPRIRWQLDFSILSVSKGLREEPRAVLFKYKKVSISLPARIADFLGGHRSSFGLRPLELVRHLDLRYPEIYLGYTSVVDQRYGGISDCKSTDWLVNRLVTFDALSFMEMLLRSMQRLARLDIHFKFSHDDPPIISTRLSADIP